MPEGKLVQVSIFFSLWKNLGDLKFPRINEIGNARFYQVWDFVGNYMIYQEENNFLPSWEMSDFFL